MKTSGTTQSRAPALGGGDADFALRLAGHRLATAEILYHLPDHPHVLQSFVWQTLDLPPRFPRLIRFLDHWCREIDAVIHSVRLAAEGDDALHPVRWRNVDDVLRVQ
jgi:uncharacterized protein Usg